jgi:hypothetical protein
MAPTKEILWTYFLASKKQNGSHIRAHCPGCIEKERLIREILELDTDRNPKLSLESWVVAGK